jgi:D-arabinose 1-dehydrogenase-like Zn-dependent alcohol dehydrogenase
MPKMRAVQVSRPKAPFEIVEREIPEPGPGSVRIKVQACGICHSDTLTRDGTIPLVQYPRVPGHEVVGVIDAVGAGVARWTPGQRAGVGWHKLRLLRSLPSRRFFRLPDLHGDHRHHL